MDSEPEDATLFPATVGEKLRAAREAQGLDIAEIAARTRIPQRHLEAIEKSNYSGLPSTTYAMGFAKAYARALGVDEVAIARDLRGELTDHYEPRAPVQTYAAGDPAREPPRGIIWVGVAIAVAVLVGVALWYGTSMFRGSAPPPESLIPVETPTPTAESGAAAEPTPPATGGQVVLTALDNVWLRVTDASGKRLFEKELMPGERYEVPQDAAQPTVRTGRADKIDVTLNGAALGALGPANQTVTLDVSADAVRARQSGAPAPAATPGISPTAPVATPPAAAPAPAPRRAAPVRPAPRPRTKASPRPAEEAPGAPVNLLPPLTAGAEAQ